MTGHITVRYKLFRVQGQRQLKKHASDYRIYKTTKLKNNIKKTKLKQHIMDNNESNEWDIMICNITKKYGSPETTYKLLNHCITNAFLNNGMIKKYGNIHNVRIPFSQDENNVKMYYGFLTMRNTNAHPELLSELKQSTIIHFGNTQLEFRQGEYLRPEKINQNIDTAWHTPIKKIITPESVFSNFNKEPKRRKTMDVIDNEQEEIQITEVKSKSTDTDLYSMELLDIQLKETLRKTQEKFIEEKMKELKEKDTELHIRKIELDKKEVFLDTKENAFVLENQSCQKKKSKSRKNVIILHRKLK
jgi:Holliday junction resolvase-like predicted endonuclease